MHRIKDLLFPGAVLLASMALTVTGFASDVRQEPPMKSCTPESVAAPCNVQPSAPCDGVQIQSAPFASPMASCGVSFGIYYGRPYYYAPYYNYYPYRPYFYRYYYYPYRPYYHYYGW
jgi:hypothetical protein